MIDIDAGVQFGAAYAAVNPQPVVPSLLVDDGPALTQSLAILEYLEETHPAPPTVAGRSARTRTRAQPSPSYGRPTITR